MTEISKVFSKDIANNWDKKSIYIEEYIGDHNPLKQEVYKMVKDNFKVLDVGCATGEIIQNIDIKFNNCLLCGIDISKDMIDIANKRIYSNNNYIKFINNDFLNYNFEEKYDLIIFGYTLHHMKNFSLTLTKARDMLKDNGNIIFTVPGEKYLYEVFNENLDVGRYNEKYIISNLKKLSLFITMIDNRSFSMKFNSYNNFIKYLKSIGTYQKINGYKLKDWDNSFDLIIREEYNKQRYITGDYIICICKKIRCNIKNMIYYKYNKIKRE